LIFNLSARKKLVGKNGNPLIYFPFIVFVDFSFFISKKSLIVLIFNLSAQKDLSEIIGNPLIYFLFVVFVDLSFSCKKKSVISLISNLSTRKDLSEIIEIIRLDFLSFFLSILDLQTCKERFKMISLFLSSFRCFLHGR